MQSTSKNTRRDFLTTGVAAASAMATGLSLTRSVHAAGSDQFKIALIGSGGRGTGATADNLRVNNCWAPITEHIHTDKTVVDLLGKIPISNVRNRRLDPVMSPYRQEHKDLLEAIWNDTPYNEGHFGATTSFTSVLGREASYSGQVVKWDELAAKGCDYFPKEEVTWETQPPVLPDENGRYDHAVALPGIYKLY